MTSADASSPVREPPPTATAENREEASLRAGFTLAAIAAAALDLLVTWQVQGNADAVNYHLLAFCAVFCVLDTHRPFPALRPALPNVLCGAVLLVSVVIKARGMVATDGYRHIFALVAGLALAIPAFGFRETARLWKIWLALALLSGADRRLEEFGVTRLHLNQMGAAISAELLLLAGYAAVAAGDVVTLPGGSAKVYAACSAAIPIVYLLKLAMLALLVFPSRWWQKIVIVAVAILTALAANAVRIAVMALLNAAGDHARFDYWHEGSGSNVFAILYMAVFCALTAGCLKVRPLPSAPVTPVGAGTAALPPPA